VRGSFGLHWIVGAWGFISTLSTLTALLLPSNLVASPENKMAQAHVRVERREKEMDAEVAECRRTVDVKSAKVSNQIETCACTPEARSESRTKLARATRNEKIKCETAGIQKTIDFIESETDGRLESLRALQQKFETEVESYNSWQEDFQQHYDETVGKIQELTLGVIADQLLSSMSKSVDGDIDDMLKRMEKYRDVRLVRKADLKQYVDALRAQMKGKSREEAKTMLRASLRGLKREMKDVEHAAKLVIDEDIRAFVKSGCKDTADAQYQEKLERAYRYLITGSELLSNQKKAALKTIGKGLGPLALAPDAMEAGFTLWTASVDGANLSGIDSLREAAEAQRKGLSEDVKYLIAGKKRWEERASELRDQMAAP